MKCRKSGLLIGSILLVIIVIFGTQKKQSNYIKLKCMYMAYACGDCDPQYKIEDITYSDKINKEELINKEIYVKFKNKKLEKTVDSLTQKCVICYDFYFEGNLMVLPNTKQYQLMADACKVALRSNCCE
jgi:hypothetical protein